jgi:hypothetical protein
MELIIFVELEWERRYIFMLSDLCIGSASMDSVFAEQYSIMTLYRLLCISFCKEHGMLISTCEGVLRLHVNTMLFVFLTNTWEKYFKE